MIILSAMIVTAITFTSSLIVEKDEKIALNDIGINDISYSQLSCDYEYCYFSISATEEKEYFNTIYNITTIKTISILNKLIKFPIEDSEKNILTLKQKETIRDKLIEKALKDIAIEQQDRVLKVKEDVSDKGTIEITNK